jgi:hypothetical protein
LFQLQKAAATTEAKKARLEQPAADVGVEADLFNVT